MKKLILAVAAVTALAGIATSANAQDSTVTGAAIGAGTGLVIAGPPGAVVGGVIGAVVAVRKSIIIIIIAFISTASAITIWKMANGTITTRSDPSLSLSLQLHLRLTRFFVRLLPTG